MNELLIELRSLKAKRKDIINHLNTNSRTDRSVYFGQLSIIDDKIDKINFKIKLWRTMNNGKHR